MKILLDVFRFVHYCKVTMVGHEDTVKCIQVCTLL
jgi:hypothetical protein